MRIATVMLLILAVLALPACQMNERMSGTAFGGTGGAVLGGLIAESLTGVLLGGVVGGVAGYLIGDYLADQRERCSPCQPAQHAPQPCAMPTYAPQPCGTYYAPQPCAPATYAPQPCAPATRYYAAPRVGAVKVRDTQAEASTAWIQRGKQAATLPEAIRAYEEAVRLDPRNAEGWNALGLARQVGGDQAGARTAFERALAVDPAHWAARQNLQWLGEAGR